MDTRFTTIRRLACLAVLAGVLAGCSSLSAWTFRRDEASGAAEGTVVLHSKTALAHQAIPTGAVDVASLTKAFPQLEPALEGQCTFAEPQSGKKGAFAGVLIPVLGKLVFDLYMDKKVHDLEALKKAAQADYAVSASLPAQELKAAVDSGECLLVLRRNEEQADKPGGFVAVLKLSKAYKDATQAFTFQLIFVQALDAVAVTRAADKPAISVALALTVKGIGKQQNGLPLFGEAGQGAVSVPNLLIGAKSEPKCVKGSCPASDAIPLMLPDGAPAVLGIGIVEKGHVGIDFDMSKSELQAIKAALGPAISDVIKGSLE